MRKIKSLFLPRIYIPYMLESLKKFMFELMRNKKLLMILFLLVVFIGLAIYVYQTYIVPRMEPQYIENKELIASDDEMKEVELYYFYAKWCPYCKKAMPEWSKFREEYENKPVNNTIIYFREINIEEDEDVAEKFGISSVPKVKLVKDNQIIDYDANVEHKLLEEFVHSVL